LSSVIQQEQSTKPTPLGSQDSDSLYSLTQLSWFNHPGISAELQKATVRFIMFACHPFA